MDGNTVAKGQRRPLLASASEPPAKSGRAPTIVDVARTAGVAVGTVSRFLNGHEVRQPRKAAIEAAIRRLRYNPNAVAKAMRTEQTNIVALLVPGYDEFFAGVLGSLTRRVALAGQVLLTHKHEGDAAALRVAMEFFHNHRVNAVVTPGVVAVEGQARAMLDQGIPVVFFNNDVPALPVDRVFSNNAEAARQAVQHLIDLGHRRIGVIKGDMSETSAQERYAGYLQALRQSGLRADPDLAVGRSWRRQDGLSGITQLMGLAAPPTAVFATNYVLGIAALDYFRESGIKVGEDVSLISFDDVEAFRQMSPGVTAVAQPSEAIGEAIGELVLDRLNRPDTAPRKVVLDCTIVLRGTTRPPNRQANRRARSSAAPA